MSGSRDGGRFSGHLVIGTVVDNNDPWQAGNYKVRWQVGSAVQDQLSDGDLPWSRTLFPPTNPSLKKVGGPHTGLLPGTRVYGFPVDGAGQDFVIIGSVVSAGQGQPDQQQTPDSEIPTGAKVHQVDGIDQPHFGDKNDVARKPDGGVVTDSIVQYARDEGGPHRRPVKFGDFEDSVGDLDAIA